jgi:ABC-type amino acid transport substrate-binding protein
MNLRNVFVTIILLLLVCSCSKRNVQVLKIGTNAEYPPFESIRDGAFVGIDMDLARRIAAKLDLDYEIVDMDFDKLIPTLQAGNLHMAISAVSITPEREFEVEFTAPYYVANQAIITHTDNTAILNSPEDLAQYKVGAQSGTTGMAYIKENFVDKDLMPKEKFLVYSSISNAIADLLQGDLDFFVIDDSAAHAYKKANPLKSALTIETYESYGIAMPKNAPLNKAINAALQDLIDSGEVLSIIQTHIH